MGLYNSRVEDIAGKYESGGLNWLKVYITPLKY